MAERIGLEAFVDTSKFKPGFNEYVTGVDKMASGTTRLSETMEETVGPTANLTNKITDLSGRLVIQQKQLELHNRELEKMINLDKATATQIERKRLQIDSLSNSIVKNTRTLGAYQKELEESRQSLALVTEEGKSAGAALDGLDLTIASFAGNTLASLLTGAASAGADALLNLAGAASDAVGSHQQLEATLETLVARELLTAGRADDMGTALQRASGRAEELGGWLEELSLRSGTIAQEDIEQTFKLANAYGFTSRESQRLTESLVNFTAGTGQSSDAAQRLSGALGQINVKQRVYQEELLQLQEAGINTGAVLEKMGLSLSDVEKGAVNADQFIATLVSLLENDFAGAAERQGDTWLGFLAKLDKTQEIALREFFTEAFEAIQPLANDLVEVLGSEEFRAALKEAGHDIGVMADEAVRLARALNWKQLANDAQLTGRVVVQVGQDFLGAVNEARNFGLFGQAFTDTNLKLTVEAAEFLTDKIREGLQLIDRMDEFKTGTNLTKEPIIDAPRGRGESIEKTPKPLTSQDLDARAEKLESLIDLYEDYGEKAKDINKKVTAASQDFADKERELRGDLAEAWQEQNTARANAAIELSNGLIEAEDEYNQAAIEIGQERLDADRELNQSRLEADQEFNTERAKLETDFNQAVAEIGQQRLEAEEELNAGKAEAQAEALAALAELEREHSEEVFDINRTLGREIEDFNRERLRAEEEFKLERDELERDHAQKVLDFTKDIEDATSDTAEKRFDIEKDLQDRLSDLEDKRKDKIGGIQEEIDEILGRRKTRGLDSESSLSKQDQKRLADLREQLAKEAEAFDEQRADIEEKAQDALNKEIERSNESLANLQDKLAKENQAYTDAIAEQDRKYAQQEEDRKLSYDRAVEDLTLRLQRENAEFDRQRSEIQTKLSERLGDLQTSYDEAISKLDQRLATERTKLDEQRTALQAKHREELIDIQQKHDEAIGKLDARLAEERTKLAEQRTALQGAYHLELADIDASYTERVATIRQKLEDVAVAHAEKQLELREQMKETRDDFKDKINEIGEAWTTTTKNTVEYVQGLMASLAQYAQQTEIPLNLKAVVPELITPGSPSPLEMSLMRTRDLILDLNSTPLTLSALSVPMMSSPPVLSPVTVGGPSFANSFGDIVLQGGIGGPQDARNLARQGGLQVESQMAGMLMDAARRQKGNYRSDFGVRT